MSSVSVIDPDLSVSLFSQGFEAIKSSLSVITNFNQPYFPKVILSLSKLASLFPNNSQDFALFLSQTGFNWFHLKNPIFSVYASIFFVF
jgi:hypothetical protein